MSGSYNNNFVLHDSATQSTVSIEAEHDAPKRRKKKKDKATGKGATDAPDFASVDFAKKVLHVAWHPQENAVAIAGLNKLYVYQATRSKRGE